MGVFAAVWFAVSSVGRAGDLDAWYAGGSAGQLDAPLSGHSGVLLSSGSRVGGAWSHASRRPLMALDLGAADSTWAPVMSWYGSAGVYGSWRPSGWAAPYDVGGRFRARVFVIDAASSLGNLSAPVAADDAAIWFRRGLQSSTRSSHVLTAEARVDFDGLTGGDALQQISGGGSGVGLGWSVRTPLRASGRTQHVAVSTSVDLRPADVAPESARQQLELRAGRSWAQTGHAWVSEVHARAGRHRWSDGESWFSASVEPRLGLRWRLGSRHQLTTLLGAGVPFRDRSSWVQPTGAPTVRAGVDLRRVSGSAAVLSGGALPAGVGELTIAARSVTGEPIAVELEDEITAGSRRTAEGHLVIPHVAGRPVSIRAEGYASLTMTPPVDGDGPWSWRPVLPPASGSAQLVLQFVDQQDDPAALTSLSIGGASLGGVSAGDVVTLRGISASPTAVFSTGPLLLPAAAELTPTPDGELQRVLVARPVGATLVSVQASGIAVPNARVEAISAVGSSVLQTDGQGLAQMRLTAGLWRVRVEAAGFAPQEQTVEIGSTVGRTHSVPFALSEADPDQDAALELIFVDPSGVPVEGAEVQVGATRVGTTASGGRLRFENLNWGDGSLNVSAPRFIPYSTQIATSGDDDQSIVVPMRWRAGQVEVRAVAMDGAPLGSATVVVRESGGELSEPRALGPDGLLAFELPAGEHELLVSAPGHTRVTVPVSVQSDRESLLVAHVVLKPSSEDRASISLRVASKLEGLVESARVLVDGQELARTSSGGIAVVDGLSAGRHEITVQTELYEPWTTNVDLRVGQLRSIQSTLKPRGGLLEVKAEYGGRPISALVRLIGPVPTRPVLLGRDGRHLFRVPSGQWEVVFSAEEFGLEVVDAVTRADRRARALWKPTEKQTPVAMKNLSPKEVTISVSSLSTGSPVDALVRALGPEVVSPISSGSTGQARLRLIPGAWEVVASSPQLGVGGADFHVGASSDVEVVRVVLGEARVEVAQDEVRLDGRVLFEVGRARIEQASLPLLKELARTLLLSPEIRHVRVEGHTDNTGDAEANLRLSSARARAVMDWLVTAGVSPDRLTAQGYGEQQPVASNEHESGRSQNRRVVLKITERAAVGGDATEAAAP